MADCTILAITRDARFHEALRRQLEDQDAAGGRMILARTIDEACPLLPTARPRLIVVHWNREGGCYQSLNHLLGTMTVLAHRVPVLVIADRYRIGQATTLYRMGVTDYISRTHHQDRFARILVGYLRRSPTKPGPRAEDSRSRWEILGAPSLSP
jgi:DNA-binding NtrC family response regulator